MKSKLQVKVDFTKSKIQEKAKLLSEMKEVIETFEDKFDTYRE